MSRKRSFFKSLKWRVFKALAVLSISVFLVLASVGIIWFATLKIPDLSVFEERKVAESTKIFDRTGEILLYDVHSDARRTIVPFEDISKNIKDATIAIEDIEFYTHMGIKPTAILRAVLANLTPGGGSTQGGSTITQQVIKNSILTKDKTLTRKLKEWILAMKLEKVLSKDDILNAYLNENPYGGSVYGVEEASKTFFGKSAKDVTLAEAAYIAAIPQAPTYYSPYGPNKAKLDARKNLVLQQMRYANLISDEEYQNAKKEDVLFLEKNTTGIRAPHFALYVKDYLDNKYGESMVEEGGLKVITTLDYKIQEKAEKVINNFAPTLEKSFNASNTAMVAIDPKTGDILTMVGSRNYFEKGYGNFNITTAYRQPGSTFKPFVYATAFMKGYTPETILFDVKTEFSSRCTPQGKPRNPNDDIKVCYSPLDYDNLFEGPQTIRTALAHSRNIPAVQALYLAGISDSIKTAEAMGITSLTDPDRYGLTLVLGGGEVSLLELTSAYGVFANDGLRNPYRSVLKVEDSDGNILEEAGFNQTQAIPVQVARQISDILSDPTVRLETVTSAVENLHRQVATKTGTTNDYKDVWIEGYTPNIVVGAWAGKNDNTPMEKKVAGLIITPVWGAFMAEINSDFEKETFKKPEPTPDNIKPVLRGIWKGGIGYQKDTVSGKLATEFTPPETRQDVIFPSVHTILHWVDKKDPLGPIPTDPNLDSQYENWEYGVRKWFDEWKKTNPTFVENVNIAIPTESDDVHIEDNSPKIVLTLPPQEGSYSLNAKVTLTVASNGKYPLKKTELYMNDKYVSTNEQNPKQITFIPGDIPGIERNNIIKVIAYDTVYNQGESTIDLNVDK
ncbi:MAG: transglycosylase domain-containing protein [Candidatus Taylorbacteria bacterium]|nr:transglycosylase domain-containing protein [Candidatus Taylorbacteria bacterium]